MVYWAHRLCLALYICCCTSSETGSGSTVCSIGRNYNYRIYGVHSRVLISATFPLCSIHTNRKRTTYINHTKVRWQPPFKTVQYNTQHWHWHKRTKHETKQQQQGEPTTSSCTPPSQFLCAWRGGGGRAPVIFTSNFKVPHKRRLKRRTLLTVYSRCKGKKSKTKQKYFVYMLKHNHWLPRL